MVKNKRIKKIIFKVTQEIKRNYDPEKIILFGSYAYGNPDKESDIDLLIVKKTSKPFRKRWVEVYEMVSDIVGGIDFSPFVITPEELKKRLKIGDQFFQEIIEQGKYLYAK